MSSALFTGRSDRTLQCALPAFLEDTAAFKQSFDLYRQLQAALKLICNSHPFYTVNRRHSSGWMNCLETTAGNSQLCWLHCQVWGELSSMVWGFFWGGLAPHRWTRGGLGCKHWELRAKGSSAAGKRSDAASGSEAEGQSMLVHRTGWDHQLGNSMQSTWLLL